MKDFKNFVIYILCGIILLCLLNLVSSYVLDKYVVKRMSTSYALAFDNKADIVCIGASRTLHHYVPSILEDSLGMSVFNYGVGGQNIYSHYAMLNIMLNHAKKPKLVILELFDIDIDDAPKHNFETLSSLYPYYNFDDSVRAIVNLGDKSNRLLISYSGLYRNNSLLLLNLYIILRPTLRNGGGYIPIYGKWKKNISVSKDEKENVSSKKIEFLTRFIKLCATNNIKLVLTDSPTFNIKRDYIWVNEIKRIAHKYDIPFLYHEEDTFFFKHPEFFKDILHLNNTGAEIYSREIAHEIAGLIKE